jgi:hypothetical protein
MSLLSSGQAPSVQTLAIPFRYENLEATAFSALSPAWIDNTELGLVTIKGTSLLFDPADSAKCRYDVALPGIPLAPLKTKVIVVDAKVSPPSFSEATCPVPQDLPLGASVKVYYASNGQDFSFTGFEVSATLCRSTSTSTGRGSSVCSQASCDSAACWGLNFC